MDLKDVAYLAENAGHLATVATVRADGSVQASVVSAGLLTHPLTGRQVLGLVAIGGTVTLRNLRRTPRATAVFQSGWEWAASAGRASLIGPDDLPAGFDPGQVPQLLRDIFTAAGGTHDDWPEYDRVMASERRTAVLVEPERIYGS